MAVDFNADSDPTLDRSAKPLLSDRSITDALTNLCRNVGVFDVSRLRNPKDRNYTFYSKPQKSYSRIDAFWVAQEILTNVWNTDIHSMIYSDHCPITLTFFPSLHYVRSSMWKLNKSLLLIISLKYIQIQSTHLQRYGKHLKLCVEVAY